MKIRYFFPILLVMSCQSKKHSPPSTASPRSETETVQLAKNAAQDAFQALSSALTSAIQSGGAVAAIPICSENAGSIVQQVAEKHGVKITRLSDQPRNPAQLATGRDAEVLQEFLEKSKTGQMLAPVVESAPQNESIVRIPIVIANPLCLQCHGKEADILPETLAAIHSRYPHDKATGYSLQDLRGIWKISIPTP